MAEITDFRKFKRYSMNSKQQSMMLRANTSNTLAANDYKEPQVVCYKLESVTHTLTAESGTRHVNCMRCEVDDG